MISIMMMIVLLQVVDCCSCVVSFDVTLTPLLMGIVSALVGSGGKTKLR